MWISWFTTCVSVSWTLTYFWPWYLTTSLLTAFLAAPYPNLLITWHTTTYVSAPWILISYLCFSAVGLAAFCSTMDLDLFDLCNLTSYLPVSAADIDFQLTCQRHGSWRDTCKIQNHISRLSSYNYSLQLTNAPGI